MENTNEDFISKLLTDLESDRIERTVSTTDTNKFNEAICAFANDYPNHRQAGYLLLGVKDDGELSGLTVTDKLLKELAAIRHNGQILPQPAMSVQKYTVKCKEIVVVVEVIPSLHPPVRFRGRVCIRTGPTKAVANETEERRLTEQRTATAKTFDALPCFGAKIEDLNTDAFKYKYLPMAVDAETLRINNRDAIEQLASLKMYDLLHNMATNAGILTVGIEPRDFMPGAYIQYVKFEGETLMSSIINEKRFSGNLVDVLKDINDFIKNNIIRTRPVKTDGFREEQVKNYPLSAISALENLKSTPSVF